MQALGRALIIIAHLNESQSNPVYWLPLEK